MKLKPRNIILQLGILIIIWVVVLLICSSVGPANASIVDTLKLWASNLPILKNYFNDSTLPHHYSVIYWQIRLPRLILATLTGMALAPTGAAFQSIFRNPMADPYVLGISSGASLGAAIAIIMGIESSFFGISGLAFLFALITLALVFFISYKGGNLLPQTLLLAGIAVSFMSAALVSLLLIVHREKIERIVFWTMGGLNAASWPQVLQIMPIVISGILVLIYYSRNLNLIALGTETARSLGVNTERTSLIVLVVSSLMVSVIVANTGVIGFAGLIIPHIVRLLTGPDNRLIIPYSILAGAIFLMVSDTIARNVMAPSELPVGSITAIFGVPYFLFLLYQSQKKL